MALEQLSVNKVFDGQLFKYKFKVRCRQLAMTSKSLVYALRKAR